MSEGNGTATSPQQSANGASPVNGQVPPVEHRFKPGNNANPGGLPKGTKLVKKRLRSALIRRLKKHPEQIDAIVEGLIAQASAPSMSKPYGDPTAQKLIWDRVDGLLTQKHEHSGGATINIRVVK